MPQVGGRRIGGGGAGQLPQIDERTSECGFKEDLDRKEFMYLNEIELLKKRKSDLSSIISLTREDIAAIHK
jgi:hypothetical protein